MSLAERWGAATVSLADLLTGLRPEIRGTTDRRWPDYAAEIVGGGFPGWRATTGRAADLLVDGYLHRIIEHDFPQGGRSVRRPACAATTVRGEPTDNDGASGGPRSEAAV